jgi:hypothetical protein
MTTETTTESWSSAWPDALAFAVGLAVAWWAGWKAADLVWGLWLSSLVVGYSIIVWSMLRPAVEVARYAWRDRELMRQSLAEWKPASVVAGGLIVIAGGLLVLTFFTFHFGMFHYIHSQFLIMFFPLDPDAGPLRGLAGMATYIEIARRYWWFLPAAFLAERAAFMRQPAPKDDRSVTVAAIAARKAANARMPTRGMMAPYRDVMRMHVLIFFLMAAHLAHLENFAVYAVVSAVYFFPWRLMRRPTATPATA